MTLLFNSGLLNSRLTPLNSVRSSQIHTELPLAQLQPVYTEPAETNWVGTAFTIGMPIAGVVLTGAVATWFLKAFLCICKPNEIVVLAGRKHKTSTGREVGYRVLTGGRAFRIPVLETVQRMDATTIPIRIEVRKAYAKGGTPLNMSTLTVQIPDIDLAKLRACADADKVSVEDEALIACRQFLQSREQAEDFVREARRFRESIPFQYASVAEIDADINEGKPFPFRYDRRHELALVGSYQLNKNISFSGNFVFASANPVTPPEAVVFIPILNPNTGEVIASTSRIVYGARNSFRPNLYHRLDLGIDFVRKRKHFERKWSIGVFNAYNRANPFYYNVTTTGNTPKGNEPVVSRFSFGKVSLIPFLPSISYIFC